MAHHQIFLECGQLVGVDGDVAERPESGRYAVDGLFLRRHLVVEIFAAARYASGGFLAQGELHVVVDDLSHAVDFEPVGADMMDFHMDALSVVVLVENIHGIGDCLLVGHVGKGDAQGRGAPHLAADSAHGALVAGPAAAGYAVGHVP